MPLLILTMLRAGWALRRDSQFATLALLALIAIVSGTGFYSIVEGLRLVDALYLSVATLATVGYGDVTPQTDAGKLFTVVYMLVGVGILLAFVTTLATKMSQTPALHPHEHRSPRVAPSRTRDATETLVMEAMGGPPLTVGDYLRELVARLRTALGDELLGVYAGGSFALGDFDQSLSDLDVAAVTATHAGRTTKQAIVELLRHESLPCPARGLEFVLYAEPVLRKATTDPGFELNLNTGARMSFRADYEPGEERHWFAIDRSVLAAHGLPLFGPPAGELFAPIPRGPLLEVVAEAVQWHRETHVVGSDAVLNACRALRFAADGVWSSKSAAGAWALERHEAPRLVAQALAARPSGESLAAHDVLRFLEGVELSVRQAAAAERSGQGGER